MHRTSFLAVALAAVVVSTASAGTLVHDTEMADADWTASITSEFGGFSFGATQVGAGGNPDAYRFITHSSTAGHASGGVAHLNIHATWNPASQGAITMLDMGIDVNCFNGGTSNAVGFGLIAVQGADVFYGPTFTALTSSGWRTDLRRLNLSAASFARSSDSAAPNFSASGAPITFGFYTGNGTASGIPIGTSSGVDNFWVVVNAACGGCAGDTDGDGAVGLSDIAAIINCWGQTTGCDRCADLDQSGEVGLGDIAAVISRWGATCAG